MKYARGAEMWTATEAHVRVRTSATVKLLLRGRHLERFAGSRGERWTGSEWARRTARTKRPARRRTRRAPYPSPPFPNATSRGAWAS
eukprot:6205844-Pleurochrysis_carterae.AAC.1